MPNDFNQESNNPQLSSDPLDDNDLIETLDKPAGRTESFESNPGGSAEVSRLVGSFETQKHDLPPDDPTEAKRAQSGGEAYLTQVIGPLLTEGPEIGKPIQLEPTKLDPDKLVVLETNEQLSGEHTPEELIERASLASLDIGQMPEADSEDIDGFVNMAQNPFNRRSRAGRQRGQSGTAPRGRAGVTSGGPVAPDAGSQANINYERLARQEIGNVAFEALSDERKLAAIRRIQEEMEDDEGTAGAFEAREAERLGLGAPDENAGPDEFGVIAYHSNFSGWRTERYPLNSAKLNAWVRERLMGEESLIGENPTPDIQERKRQLEALVAKLSGRYPKNPDIERINHEIEATESLHTIYRSFRDQKDGPAIANTVNRLKNRDQDVLYDIPGVWEVIKTLDLHADELFGARDEDSLNKFYNEVTLRAAKIKILEVTGDENLTGEEKLAALEKAAEDHGKRARAAVEQAAKEQKDKEQIESVIAVKLQAGEDLTPEEQAAKAIADQELVIKNLVIKQKAGEKLTKEEQSSIELAQKEQTAKEKPLKDLIDIANAAKREIEALDINAQSAHIKGLRLWEMKRAAARDHLIDDNTGRAIPESEINDDQLKYVDGQAKWKDGRSVKWMGKLRTNAHTALRRDLQIKEGAAERVTVWKLISIDVLDGMRGAPSKDFYTDYATDQLDAKFKAYIRDNNIQNLSVAEIGALARAAKAVVTGDTNRYGTNEIVRDASGEIVRDASGNVITEFRESKNKIVDIQKLKMTRYDWDDASIQAFYDALDYESVDESQKKIKKESLTLAQKEALRQSLFKFNNLSNGENVMENWSTTNLAQGESRREALYSSKGGLANSPGEKTVMAAIENAAWEPAQTEALAISFASFMHRKFKEIKGGGNWGFEDIKGFMNRVAENDDPEKYPPINRKKVNELAMRGYLGSSDEEDSLEKWRNASSWEQMVIIMNAHPKTKTFFEFLWIILSRFSFDVSRRVVSTGLKEIK